LIILAGCTSICDMVPVCYNGWNMCFTELPVKGIPQLCHIPTGGLWFEDLQSCKYFIYTNQL